MNRTDTKPVDKLDISYGDYLKVAVYSKYIKTEIVIKVILGLFVTALYVVQAILLAKGLGLAVAREPFAKVVWYFVFAACCIVVRSVLVWYIEGYTKKVGGKIKSILRELVVDKLLLLGPGYQSDKRSGRFQSLITDGVEYIEPYLAQYIPQVFIVLCSVIPIVAYIYYYSLAAGLVITICVLLAIFMPHILMPFYTMGCIGYWKEYARLNAHFIDIMQGMNTLKMFNAEQDKKDELEEASEAFRKRQLYNTRNSLFSNGNIALMTGIATSFVTGVAAYAAAGGRLPIPVLLVIMFLVIECVRPIGDLNNAWHSSMMGFSVASEILEILDEKIPTREKENAVSEGIDEGLPKIELENVCFRYSSKREQALDGLTMDVMPGETVAVVGSSGAGKSTLVNLLLRFYDIDSGSIKINGIAIDDLKLDYLRQKIAVVFQNTYLFYGTVRENISMARPDATEEEIIAAAKAANAHEFIERLPAGYDTMVGERGDTLSGGQKQRIAIARAILKNAPILLMDEATSSVDAASEELIQHTMDDLKGRFTTIMIAHRLSTIQNAHRIYVFDKGRAVECGNHRELLEKGGIYLKLTEAQRGEENE